MPQLATISYVPATVRATLYALGRPLTIEINDETIALSPSEMLGESDWRADLLRWLVRKTMFHLLSMQPDERVDRLEDIETSLVRDCSLHKIEAHAVTELAFQSLDRLTLGQISSIEKRRTEFEARLDSEWNALAARYEQLVKADIAAAHS